MKTCDCGGKLILAEIDREQGDATFLCEHSFTAPDFDNDGEGHLMELTPITADVTKRMKEKAIISLPNGDPYLFETIAFGGSELSITNTTPLLGRTNMGEFVICNASVEFMPMIKHLKGATLYKTKAEALKAWQNIVVEYELQQERKRIMKSVKDEIKALRIKEW